MKRKLFLATVMSIFICSIAFSQRRGHHNNRGTTYTTYSSNGHYYGYDDYGNRNDRYRRDYRRDYDRYYHRMSRSERRCVRDLFEKLDRRKRRAWEDGYLSRRDRDRIRSVEREIDRVFNKYRRYDNDYYYRNSNRSYRYQSGCR